MTPPAPPAPTGQAPRTQLNIIYLDSNGFEQRSTLTGTQSQEKVMLAMEVIRATFLKMFRELGCTVLSMQVELSQDTPFLDQGEAGTAEILTFPGC